ncbi:MAG: TonB-dependent receptor plug domain-containing protein [Deltaproteobacteria bacterium]|nr:TonB-dependent receptor plug domain-containing protein [Deltaproteobacteria bacterium]
MPFRFFCYIIIAIVIIQFPSISQSQETDPDDNSNGETLPEVVVTATRTESDRQRLPYIVDTVASDDMSNKSLFASSDLMPELSGFNMYRGGGYGAPSVLSFRGADKSHTLFLIDGIPISNPFFGSADVESLTLFGFDKIEIVKTDQSVLYGTEAVNGVVNFRTDPQPTPATATLLGRVGNFGLFETGARVSGKNNDNDDAYSLAVLETEIAGRRDDEHFHALHVSGYESLWATDSLNVTTTLRFLDTRKELSQDIIFDPAAEQLRMVKDKNREFFTKAFSVAFWRNTPC